jgi:hypothetical protein
MLPILQPGVRPHSVGGLAYTQYYCHGWALEPGRWEDAVGREFIKQKKPVKCQEAECKFEFFCPSLSCHTCGFPVSSEGPPHSVAYYDTLGLCGGSILTGPDRR